MGSERGTFLMAMSGFDPTNQRKRRTQCRLQTNPAFCTHIPAAASGRTPHGLLGSSAPCWEVRRAWMCQVSMRPLCTQDPLTHPPREAGIVIRLHFTNVETEAARGLETCPRSQSSPMVICLSRKKKKDSWVSHETTLPPTKCRACAVDGGSPRRSTQTPASVPTVPSAPMPAGTGGWAGPRDQRVHMDPRRAFFPQISNIQVASGARMAVGGGWSSGRRDS